MKSFNFTSPVLLSLIFVVLPLAFAAMGLFSRKNHLLVAGRTVLITGGSQGMGRGLAKIFAQKGAHVIVVARNVDKLKAAVDYITKFAAKPESQRFTYISADVTIPEENARLLKEAIAWNNGNAPDIIWANAGSAHPGLFAETSIEVLRSQMDIDYWAAAYLAHETMKIWIEDDKASKIPGAEHEVKATTKSSPQPPSRHFVITSSVIAFVGFAGYAPYAPAKSALRSLADTMRSELQLYNGANTAARSPRPKLLNHIVFPMGIISPGLEAENKLKHPVTVLLEEDDKPQTEDEVAIAAIAGLERGDFQITTHPLAWLMRASTMGGSPRNGLGVLDTLMSWVGSIAWLFIGPDFEKKVFNWGKKNGINGELAKTI